MFTENMLSPLLLGNYGSFISDLEWLPSAMQVMYLCNLLVPGRVLNQYVDCTVVHLMNFYALLPEKPFMVPVGSIWHSDELTLLKGFYLRKQEQS